MMYTDEQLKELIDEMLKVTSSPLYFSKYFTKRSDWNTKIILDGLTSKDARKVAIYGDRDTKKTTATLIYILWVMFSMRDQTAVILGRSNHDAKNLQLLFCALIKSLPEFLQTEVKSRDMCLEFSTGCKVLFRVANSNSLRGMTINILYIDNYKMERQNLSQTKDFLECVALVSCLQRSKVIVSSDWLSDVVDLMPIFDHEHTLMIETKREFNAD